MSKKRPIGIFDSGIGGLTVFKEIEKLLPQENIIYFGDTARVPYGSKSKATIIKFTTQSVLFLLKKKVKAIVIACNTSSALSLSYLQRVFNIPIIGVIESGVNKALAVSKNKRIGIIATKSTIASGSYQKLIFKKNKLVKVFSRSCPLFVSLAEEGILNGKITHEVIDMYLKEFKKESIDTIILGCTHYPLLKAAIGKYLKGVNIVDSAKEVASYTKKILETNNLLNTSNIVSKKEFYVSDEPQGFSNAAKLFLKRKVSKPKVVDV